jgi:hypothetical protein
MCRYFEPGRVSLIYLQHTTDVQRLRIFAERAGAINWVNADRVTLTVRGVKKPDAICTDPFGRRVAIECERTLKGRKSYIDILSAHLTAISFQKWSRVIWVAPTEVAAERLRGVIESVKCVRIDAVNTALDRKKHLSMISFCSYDSIQFLFRGQKASGTSK